MYNTEDSVSFDDTNFSTVKTLRSLLFNLILSGCNDLLLIKQPLSPVSSIDLFKFNELHFQHTVYSFILNRDQHAGKAFHSSGFQ